MSAALPTSPTDSGVLVRGLGDPGDGAGVVRGDLVEVAVLNATLQHVRVDVDDQRHAVVHRHRQGLGAAHAAGTGGDGESARQRAAEAEAGDLGEALVRALQDALGADVDPRPGGHLAVHGEALGLETTELVPVGPVGHQVGVGHDHSRRPLVGPDTRPTGLPDCTSIVSSRSSVVSVRSIAR
jgi:hypothetical protein